MPKRPAVHSRVRPVSSTERRNACKLSGCLSSLPPSFKSIKSTCSCYQDCDHHEVTANIRLWDRFILGLRDTDMQQEVMKEHYDQSLSLERVLQICLAYNPGGVCMRARSGCRFRRCQSLPTEKNYMPNPESRSTVALIAGNQNTLVTNAQPHGSNVEVAGNLVTL